MLDIIRVLASAIVAFAHLTQAPFSTGWKDVTDYGRDAVAVFFVLSGFVIRYVTTRHKSDLQEYLADRLSRIYSVAIPALIITLLLDVASRRVNPAFYAYWAPQYVHPITRILINLAFCGQIWHHSVDPLSNSPYWSIIYEVAYYLGYGCFFYLAGRWRWIAVIGVCLFFGPSIVLLAPLWIGGCIVFDLYQRWNISGTMAINMIRSAMLLAILGSLLIVYRSIKHKLAGGMLILRHAIHLDGQRLNANNVIFGIVWMLIFMSLIFLAKHFALDSETKFIRITRFIAEGTFPIYLLHFPIYVLIASCIHYNHGSATSKLLIFAFTLTIGILAGHPCNLLKIKLRSMAAHLGVMKSSPQ
jgi:peptidoglycan/LPS O-acetylase OafA/YrhL